MPQKTPQICAIYQQSKEKAEKGASLVKEGRVGG